MADFSDDGFVERLVHRTLRRRSQLQLGQLLLLFDDSLLQNRNLQPVPVRVRVLFRHFPQTLFQSFEADAPLRVLLHQPVNALVVIGCGQEICYKLILRIG